MGSWHILSTGVLMILFWTNVNCCPSVCICRTVSENIVVDCSNQNLLSVPINIPVNVSKLDLSDNQILNMDHSSLEGFNNLIYLNLGGNKDLMISNSTFQDLFSLTELDIHKTSIMPETLFIPSSVQSLIAANNEWGLFNMSQIRHLQKLKYLDLSGNNLTELTENTFPPLPSLNVLNVSKNNIKTITQESFKVFPMLHKLILNYNPVSEIADMVFKPLSQLKSLSISHMPNLFYLNRHAFSGLQSLSTLDMNDNPQLEYLHISLFSDLVNAKIINLSHNKLGSIHPAMFQRIDNVTIDVKGNHFPCDCNIEWLSNQNHYNIYIKDITDIVCYEESKQNLIYKLQLNELHCGEVLVNVTKSKYETAIGQSTILNCNWQGNPPPLVTWVTPRGKKLIYYASHELVRKFHPSREDVMINGPFHKYHKWHNSSSYQSDMNEYSDRLLILSDGSLFIDYMLRSDSGPYTCTVENSRNTTSMEITLLIDQTILTTVKIWSILIGLASAASFFTLNLIYVVITALIRRCINQRRREAILKLVENIDQYKSAQLSRLKDNYYTQVNRIRDGYHNQLERIRDNYASQAGRFKSGASQGKEWASQKVDTIRENYNSQVTRLKENSAQRLEQLRDTYNNQLLRIRDYGSAQMTRIHKKYKLQQRHVIKLLETMNFDNCRTLIDSECVRTESMIFETHPDLNIPSPETDSELEYHTATSSSETLVPGQPILTQVEAVCVLTSSQLIDEHSSPDINENSSSLDDFIENKINYEYNCGEMDQMLVQIQMIDESDEENVEERNKRESCV